MRVKIDVRKTGTLNRGAVAVLSFEGEASIEDMERWLKQGIGAEDVHITAYATSKGWRKVRGEGDGKKRR